MESTLVRGVPRGIRVAFQFAKEYDVITDFIERCMIILLITDIGSRITVNYDIHNPCGCNKLQTA